MITLNQFNDLTKNAKYQWEMARNEFPSVRNELAVVVSVSERTSDRSIISGNQTARRRNDGDDAVKGTVKQGYTKSFTQAEIALQVDVTKQMRKFDKYGEIMDRMRMMGRGAERRMEMDLASLLSYAWSTSYTNIDGETVTVSPPDGLSLINAAHTANGSSNTFSNQIPTTNSPIDPDVLETLEELGNNFIDDSDGRLIPCQFDTIISGRHAPTVHEITRILNPVNGYRTGSANHDRSTYNGYKHIVVPFIDMNMATEARDSNKYRYVFVASLGASDNGLRIEQSQGIEFETPEQVFESGVWQYGTSALYDYGVTRANFVAATKGDNSSV